MQDGLVAEFASRIRTCTRARDVEEGEKLHFDILHSQHHHLQRNRYLLNLLIEMYGECGHLDKARQVFTSLDNPNIFSWNILMAAFSASGRLQETKHIFDRIPEKNVVSWNTLITAYAQCGDMETANMILSSMPQPDTVSWNAVLKGYVQSRDLQSCESLFEKMPRKDAASWNTMIEAYASQGHLSKAIGLLERMREPDQVTWTILMRAYAFTGQLLKARELFNSLRKPDQVAWNVMISAYAQEGRVEEAKELFDQMPHRDHVSWNALITAYAENGHLDEACSLLRKMPRPGVVPHNVLIARYGHHGQVDKAQEIFDSMKVRDVVSWNALITAHAVCGSFDRCKVLFERMPQRQVTSWNVMIWALLKQERSPDAIRLLSLMDVEGVFPDRITVVLVVQACSSLLQVRAVHAAIMHSSLETHLEVANALVITFARCGDLYSARLAFDSPGDTKDVKLWTSMIAAYSLNSRGEEALQLLSKVHLEGVQVDEVVYSGVLHGCSHSGLIKEAFSVFVSIMQGDYGIQVSQGHVNSMIDLVGRCGNVETVRQLIGCMPFETDAKAWTSLLCACRAEGNFGLGAQAAHRVMQLEPFSDSPVRLLTQILDVYVG